MHSQQEACSMSKQREITRGCAARHTHSSTTAAICQRSPAIVTPAVVLIECMGPGDLGNCLVPLVTCAADKDWVIVVNGAQVKRA
jgi:hypothetical protein